MKKQLISMVLMAAMTVSMLTGCETADGKKTEAPSSENQAAFEALHGPAQLIGRVQAAPEFEVTTVNQHFSASLQQLHTAFEEVLPCHMNQKA